MSVGLVGVRSTDEEEPTPCSKPTRRLVHGAPIFVCALLAVLVVVNQGLALVPLPDYGTWTGLRPLEGKLRLLTRFAQAGPVDAVVLGSSIADTGFNAELYSRLLSAEMGQPYRAFNFSTGGAEVATLPLMYRMVRTVTVPRTLLLVIPAGIKRGEGALPHMPDSTLLKSPIHRTLEHQWLLNLDKQLWDQSLVRYASPLRDKLLYRAYPNLKSGIADSYRVSDNGDRIVYGFEAPIDEIVKLRGLFMDQLEEPGDVDGNPKRYFNETDIRAIQELRELAAADGTELVVIGHAPASTMYERPPIADYSRRRGAYLTTLAQMLDARLVNALDDLWIARYQTADTVHVNVHGAELFTLWTTRAMLGHEPIPGLLDAALARRPWPAPDLSRVRSDDPTMTHLGAVIPHGTPDTGTTLRLELLQNMVLDPIPDGNLVVGLRLPGEVDLFAPAERVGGAWIQATFPELSAQAGQVAFARVLLRRGDAYGVAAVRPSRYQWISP